MGRERELAEFVRICKPEICGMIIIVSVCEITIIVVVHSVGCEKWYGLGNRPLCASEC